MPPPHTPPGVIVAFAESLHPAESPLRQMIWLLRSTLAGQSLVSLSPDALNGATDMESQGRDTDAACRRASPLRSALSSLYAAHRAPPQPYTPSPLPPGHRRHHTCELRTT